MKKFLILLLILIASFTNALPCYNFKSTSSINTNYIPNTSTTYDALITIDGTCPYGCTPGSCDCWHQVNGVWRHKSGGGKCPHHHKWGEDPIHNTPLTLDFSVILLIAVFIGVYLYFKTNE